MLKDLSAYLKSPMGYKLATAFRQRTEEARNLNECIDRSSNNNIEDAMLSFIDYKKRCVKNCRRCNSKKPPEYFEDNKNICKECSKEEQYFKCKKQKELLAIRKKECGIPCIRCSKIIMPTKTGLCLTCSRKKN
jgi:hypothetical protein